MSDKTEQKEALPTEGKHASDKCATDTSQGQALPSSGKKRHQILRVVSMLVMAFALIALVSLLWTGWQQHSLMLKETDQAILYLNQRTKTLSEESAKLRASLSRHTEKSASLASALSNIQERVNAQGRRMAQLGSTTHSDWLLAEASYLARLANQRLQTERSVENSLALLANVDRILKQLDVEDLMPVRRELAQDIAALRLVNDVDRQGIYLELQALAEAVESLPLLDFNPQMMSPSDPVVEQSAEGTVESGFFYELRSLIRISKRQNPIEPLLQPSEGVLIKYNLQMLFQQAQIALMREEQIIFENSLLKIENFLSRFFQPSASVETVNNRLKTLRQLSVHQQLPVISRTLQALETLVLTRQQPLTEAGSAEMDTVSESIP